MIPQQIFIHSFHIDILGTTQMALCSAHNLYQGAMAGIFNMAPANSHKFKHEARLWINFSLSVSTAGGRHICHCYAYGAGFSFIYKEFLRDVSFNINLKIFKVFSQTFCFVRRLRRIFGRTDGLCDGKVKFGQIADLR